ncbi:MAG: protease Do [Acidobacteria bacterium]|nr:MAG: protease Do [Acidobacteriota bacterium]
MHTRLFQKGSLAAIALATITVAAWKAPERTVSAAPAIAGAPAVATAARSLTPVASYAPVVERVMPAVVTIRVEKRASAIPTAGQMPDDDLFRRFFGQGMPQMPRGRQPRGMERGLGSGVIVSEDGYILTNNHVVDSANEVKVELPDKRTFTAKVVGTDPASDLAVVKINASSLPTLTLGDSDSVKVGDVVLAVGNPLGVGETVTSGIISAKGRTTDVGDGSYQDFLQTDAPINHGNSGGALVSANGELIGINSQILTPSDGNIGLGFAIPSNMARNVMDQLIKNGTVHRAKLGVTVQGITADLASSLGLPSAKGALVSNVEDGSPAARAGITQGDVITEYNGKPVADSNQLRNDVSSTTPGSSVSLKVFRNGRTETMQAKLGELATKREKSDSSSEPRGEGRFGLGLQPLTPDLAEEAGVPRGTRGVIVVEVDPSGIAADSGMREGDVIEKVDGKAVTTVAEVKSALDRKDGKPSLLVVNRKGTDIFLTLRAE